MTAYRSVWGPAMGLALMVVSGCGGGPASSAGGGGSTSSTGSGSTSSTSTGGALCTTNNLSGLWGLENAPAGQVWTLQFDSAGGTVAAAVYKQVTSTQWNAAFWKGTYTVNTAGVVTISYTSTACGVLPTETYQCGMVAGILGFHQVTGNPPNPDSTWTPNPTDVPPSSEIVKSCGP